MVAVQGTCVHAANDVQMVEDVDAAEVVGANVASKKAPRAICLHYLRSDELGEADERICSDVAPDSRVGDVDHEFCSQVWIQGLVERGAKTLTASRDGKRLYSLYAVSDLGHGH